MPESLALKICREEVKKAGSIRPVAQKLGYSRSSINLYLRENYPAKSVEKIETRILTVFTDRIFCPFAEQIISQQKCSETNRQGINTTNPMLYKLHQYCQRCPVKHNPQQAFMKQFKQKKPSIYDGLPKDYYKNSKKKEKNND